MAKHDGSCSNEDANPKPEEKRRCCWKRVLLATVTLVTIAAAWRTLYQANQRELHLRRKLQKDQILSAALVEVPGKLFSVTDVNPEVIRKRSLLE